MLRTNLWVKSPRPVCIRLYRGENCGDEVGILFVRSETIYQHIRADVTSAKMLGVRQQFVDPQRPSNQDDGAELQVVDELVDVLGPAFWIVSAGTLVGVPL